MSPIIAYSLPIKPKSKFLVLLFLLYPVSALPCFYWPQLTEAFQASRILGIYLTALRSPS